MVCNTGNHSGGLNAASFCAKLWEESRKDVGELAKQRHIDPEVLELWEVRKSLTRNDWLIPGYNQSGKISNVYSYRRMKSGWRVIPTPTLGHQLFGMHLWKSTKNIVFICEGPWDSMALWDILSRTTVVGEELGYSKDPEDLLTNDINVVGVPGSNTFLDAWLPLFRNKAVNIVFDNDHPKLNTKTGRMMKPAGLTGTRRLAGIVGEVAEEVNYLNWGPEGYDKNYKDGLDIRDMLTLSDERIKSA